MPWFRNDSDLAPLRSHPRYQSLITMIETGGVLAV
jgi:hypothetical protein